MKNVFAVLGMLVASVVWADTSRIDTSRGLFAQVLASPVLVERLRSVPNTELIAIEEKFVPNGRGSHTDFEITYGVPDDIGGYQTVDCLTMELVSEAATPGNHGHPRILPSDEQCHPDAP